MGRPDLKCVIIPRMRRLFKRLLRALAGVLRIHLAFSIYTSESSIVSRTGLDKAGIRWGIGSMFVSSMPVSPKAASASAATSQTRRVAIRVCQHWLANFHTSGLIFAYTTSCECNNVNSLIGLGSISTWMVRNEWQCARFIVHDEESRLSVGNKETVEIGGRQALRQE